MKIVVDTNVLIDAFTHRQPYYEDAKSILQLITNNEIEGFITSSSITDIYYLIRKILSDFEAREIIRNLMTLFSVIDVSGADCKAALDLEIGDFEDALIVVCGRKIKADYIVSRDEDFAKASETLRVILPKVFLKKMK